MTNHSSLYGKWFSKLRLFGVKDMGMPNPKMLTTPHEQGVLTKKQKLNICYNALGRKNTVFIDTIVAVMGRYRLNDNSVNFTPKALSGLRTLISSSWGRHDFSNCNRTDGLIASKGHGGSSHDSPCIRNRGITSKQ